MIQRLVLISLAILIIAFYGGVAGAASAPYLNAVQGLVQDAAGGHSTSLQQGTSASSPMRTPSGVSLHLTPAQRSALAAAVQHYQTSGTLSTKRINFLLLGSDNDAKFSSYSNPLTQVMIVLSIDPVSKTLTLLSIPRDFWVHIPAYGHNVGPDGTIGWSKIDVAAEFGYNSAACTVETNFGIPIDRWMWVGLKGFIKVIDTLNGVTLDVPHPVIDDTYPNDLAGNPYAYRRVYIPPGPQRLNGNDALHFVRSRHGDVQEDFGRSNRQQILLAQVRKAILNQDPTTLVGLVPTLLSDFHGELKTDIPTDVGTAVSYVQLFRSAATYKVQQVILSPPYSEAGYSARDSDPSVEAQTGEYPTIESAVLPNWPAINAELKTLFGGQDFSKPHCAASTVVK